MGALGASADATLRSAIASLYAGDERCVELAQRVRRAGCVQRSQDDAVRMIKALPQPLGWHLTGNLVCRASAAAGLPRPCWPSQGPTHCTTRSVQSLPAHSRFQQPQPPCACCRRLLLLQTAAAAAAACCKPLPAPPPPPQPAAPSGRVPAELPHLAWLLAGLRAAAGRRQPP